ncbi:hypothetical protein FACS1894167_07360 [Synergistales bacterium]|nr:hypothetical protein FACS1894167_07360 [Synergistales bacterium]
MSGMVSIVVNNGCLKVVGEIQINSGEGEMEAFVAEINQKLLGDKKSPKLPSFGIMTKALIEEEAARYIGHSKSFLRKCRLEGSANGGTRGPKYTRDSMRCVRYPIDELDKWLASRARYETNCEILSNNGE